MNVTEYLTCWAASYKNDLIQYYAFLDEIWP